MTYATPNHLSCNLSTREKTQWPAFDQNNEYCGEIHKIAAWAVPTDVHQHLGLSDHNDLYLTTNGNWATTLEIAEHLLINTEAPTEFIVKGNTLSLFVAPQWAEDNGNPNTHSDYRVFRTAAGYWDAEEVQGRILVAAGNEF